MPLINAVAMKASRQEASAIASSERCRLGDRMSGRINSVSLTRVSLVAGSTTPKLIISGVEPGCRPGGGIIPP